MSVLVNSEFGQVQQIKLSNDVMSLVIEHNNCQAKVSLYGGQVLSWKPTGQQDVFWLSKTSPFEQGKAIRGGIPLCWPWFGSHPDDIDNKAGNHGFAREKNWQVDDIGINKELVSITLTLQGNNMHSWWPNAFKLTQVLSFGLTFSQSLTVSNLSDEDAYYTGALHSYFRVSSPENIIIDTLDEAKFYDKLTDKHYPPQVLTNGVGPVDRIYQSNKKIQLIDSQFQRVIEVNASNTAQWVFWNPGVTLANNMADIHLNGEQEFVCLEAANTDSQLLESGQSQTISQTVKIIPHV